MDLCYKRGGEIKNISKVMLSPKKADCSLTRKTSGKKYHFLSAFQPSFQIA
jgi:hypothetical protein